MDNIEKKKNYYENFKEKHSDKIKEKLSCPICGGTYSYFNKSKHNTKAKKHLKALEIMENIKIKYDKYLLKNE